MEKRSPKYVRTSNAAAITLGLIPGRFYRDAKLHCINLLLTYGDEQCAGSCAYCGLANNRGDGDSFIRVGWPIYALDDVIERMKGVAHAGRVCISMITHQRAYEDTLEITKKIRSKSDIMISALVTPTLINEKSQYQKLKDAGCDWVGIAVDASTQELFEEHRGSGVGGPHRWDTYWSTVKTAAEIFPSKISIHLVVGLGESDEQLTRAIQRCKDYGGEAHLFSFYPEAGSKLEGLGQPALIRYRRAQIANHLITRGMSTFDKMSFEDGVLKDFGISESELVRLVEAGDAFITNGCPDKDGNTACNRPYSNCTPGQAKAFGPRNFPFQPTEEDTQIILEELRKDGLLSPS